MKGRKPLPTSLKILKGNPGRRPLNPNEPQPDPGMPVMPKELSTKARKFWKRHAGAFYAKGILTKFDGVAFGGLCEALTMLEQANTLLERDGLIIIGQSGFPTKHPAINIKKDALGIIRLYCSEFGLTPSSRTRVKVNETASENPLKALLGQKR